MLVMYGKKIVNNRRRIILFSLKIFSPLRLNEIPIIVQPVVAFAIFQAEIPNCCFSVVFRIPKYIHAR